MSTRTLIIPNEALLAIANAPADAKVESTGPTTGTERGKMDGVYAVISSDSFKPEGETEVKES